MLQRNKSFAKNAGIEIDGLHPDAYQYCVYGNPPFDGNVRGKNTIIETLDAAEKASIEKDSFRAVFFLPLTDSKLKGRLEHQRARLLVKFPDNSVPFISPQTVTGMVARKPEGATGRSTPAWCS
jgi:hypothetical protein